MQYVHHRIRDIINRCEALQKTRGPKLVFLNLFILAGVKNRVAVSQGSEVFG